MRRITTANYTLALAVLLALSTHAQDAPPPPQEMRDFFRAWLVVGDEEMTKTYFSTSERAMSLVPGGEFPSPNSQLASAIRQSATARTAEQRGKDLRDGYLDLMNRIWRPAARRSGADALSPPVRLERADQEVIDNLESRFGVRVLSRDGDPFIAFVAETEVSVTTFDYTNGEAVEILRPTEQETLGLLIGIIGEEGQPSPGPFVSFWQEEEEGWRIQMVGALHP